MFAILINFVIFLLPSAYSANILAVMPMPSYSHQIAYTQLWRELSLRGHKVTVITTDPLKDPKLTNLTEIDMKWSYKFFKDISTLAEKEMNMWTFYDTMSNVLRELTQAQIAYPPVQELIHNRTSGFDVVLVEFIFPEHLAFAHIYKCPKILISSFDTNAHYYRAMGNPVHPNLHPDLMSSFYRPLSFKDRVINTLFSWYVSYFHAFKWFPVKENIAKKYFNISSTLDEIIHDVDMLFLNVNPIIQGARAIGPTTINIGGHREPISPKPLPADLKKFLDDAKDGFIYFSLGSNVKSNELNEETLKSIIETLSELPYKILWKFEAEDLPGKPNNVKLVQWTPQQQVLSHPNIKLFITQGGLQSMEEAIYGTVPMVVIPFFADQEKNADLMVAKGIAKLVNRRPYVKKNDLKNAIVEVITDPSYKNTVTRLKHLVLDNPMTGLEKAVWWTEYVIRNKGAKHLRNPAADIPFYQYYLIDVISFLVLSIALVFSILIISVKKLIKTILYIFKDSKIVGDKKIK